MAEQPTYSCIDQVQVLSKGPTTCRHHPDRQLELYCRQCDDLVCSKCLSSGHNEMHSVCELGEIIPERKRDIQNLIERTEQNELVLIHEYITSTETQLQDNASRFEKLAFEVKTQTTKLKEDLDLLSAQTLSVYSQMAEDNTILLQTYRQDLEIYESQLKEKLEECKCLLHRGTHIDIYHLGCTTHYDDILPFKPTLRTAGFTANENPQTYLKRALGDVTTGQSQSSGDQDLSSGSSSDHAAQMGEESNESERSMFAHNPQSELLPQTKVVKEFTSPHMISSVCHTTDDQRWVSYFNSGSLAFLDRTCLVKCVFRHSVNVKDISVSPVSDALWTCHVQDRSIRELVSGKLKERFKTKVEPLCMCVTASGHVIVGMVKHISKFTKKGKVVLTTLATGTKKPLVYTPLRISECPVTQNVAVIDEDFTDHGGEGKRNVVVMDTGFHELFRYRGEIPATYQETTESESLAFVCYGIGFDRLGNLVLGDHSNRRVLLISGRGDFIRVLHTDEYNTWDLSVNRNNVVFAVFNRDIVRLLQYHSE